MVIINNKVTSCTLDFLQFTYIDNFYHACTILDTIRNIFRHLHRIRTLKDALGGRASRRPKHHTIRFRRKGSFRFPNPSATPCDNSSVTLAARDNNGRFVIKKRQRFPLVVAAYLQYVEARLEQFVREHVYWNKGVIGTAGL